MTISANAALPGSYDYAEVARSVLIAVAASYAGLDLAGRVTTAKGGVRLAWLSGGATAMGIGVWAMHLKGMLAFRLPVSVAYHWPTLLAALLVAISASAVALYVASGRKMGLVEALTGSVFVGAGIAGLHYLGMAAMRLPAITQYSPVLVTCSILLAILFSLIALLMAFDLREETQMDCSTKAWQRHRDGICRLRHALHRHVCCNFHPRLTSESFPRCEHLSPCQQWNCHSDLDRDCGRHCDIVRGKAGERRSAAAQ